MKGYYPTYLSGTVVNLSAASANGWYFIGWAGDLSGVANPAQVTLDADKAVTATFSLTVAPYQVYLPLVKRE